VARDRVRAAYDALASVFAERHAEIPPGVAAAADRFLAALDRRPHILDLGCGHGRDAEYLAARGATVVGADLSWGMLAHALQRAFGSLVECDLRHLPFAERAFTGVWCNASLLHVPKIDAPGVLAEIRRILANNGVLYVGIQEGDEECWEPTTWVNGEARFFARYRAEDFQRLLDQAGFLTFAREVESDPDRTWLRFVARRTTPTPH
jgi:ubiquinone/menaquinone biosynthesis C-methylase UbiE